MAVSTNFSTLLKISQSKIEKNELSQKKLKRPSNLDQSNINCGGKIYYMYNESQGSWFSKLSLCEATTSSLAHLACNSIIVHLARYYKSK